MQARLRKTRRLDVLAIILLATFVFRSYIPVGFMPASGTPFLLELCPAYAGVMPSPHEHHHHHSQTHTDFQDCPFGSAPAQGPVSERMAFAPAGQTPAIVDRFFRSALHVSRPLRAHPPRGPPFLA